MCTSFTIIPTERSTDSKSIAMSVSRLLFTDSTFTNEYQATSLYNNIQLEAAGLSMEAFDYAIKGYHVLLGKNQIRNNNYITVCDFSQSSNKKRLYIIDIENQRLVTNTYVAHGKNSGGAFATAFSNQPESLQSSLGFYVTSQTYIGKHGLSLRVIGVDPGYNDKALQRTIVMHGAAYVNEARAKAGILMGRSWGCPAVPEKEATSIINKIKDGTCLFIYHPGKNYLLGSKILNG